MGYSSQTGKAIFRTQSALGVAETDFADEGVIMKLRSGSLAPQREVLTADPEIGGGRDVTDAYLSTVAHSGDYEFYLRTRSFLTLLRACLGTASSTPDGVNPEVTNHEFAASDSSQLPILTIGESLSDNFAHFVYQDAVVNTIHLESDAAGFVQGTAGLIAKRGDSVDASDLEGTAEWDDGVMFVGTNANVTYNGVTLPAKSFSLDVNNNFEDDDYRLGSFYLGDLTPKRREITASFSIRPEDSTLWKQAVWGSAGATAASGATTKAPLVITMDSYEQIGATGVVEQVKFEFPNFALSPFTIDVSGDDIIETDLEGNALRPKAGVPAIKATVRNGTAAIA